MTDRFLRRLSSLRVPFRKGITANAILTRRCNTRCAFCEVIHRNNGIELSIEDWKKVIRNVCGKFATIVFTGGEPLLYSGVEELIDYAHGRAFTGLLTNGILLDEKTAEKLTKLDYLNVSSERLFRDHEGQAEPWASLLTRIKRSGTFVASTIVITPENIHQVPGIIEFLTRKGIPAEISIVHTKDKASAYGFRSDNPELGFRAAEDIAALKSLQDRLISMKRAGYLIHTPDSYITGMAAYAEHKQMRFKCFAADKFICINNDGFIMPCQDLAPSCLNAMNAEDVERIHTLKNSIPDHCSCFWDCAYFYSLLDIKSGCLAGKELFFNLQNHVQSWIHQTRRPNRHEFQKNC